MSRFEGFGRTPPHGSRCRASSFAQTVNRSLTTRRRTCRWSDCGCAKGDQGIVDDDIPEVRVAADVLETVDGECGTTRFLAGRPELLCP